jgi:hypothetical protein
MLLTASFVGFFKTFAAIIDSLFTGAHRDLFESRRERARQSEENHSLVVNPS